MTERNIRLSEDEEEIILKKDTLYKLNQYLRHNPSLYNMSYKPCTTCAYIENFIIHKPNVYYDCGYKIFRIPKCVECGFICPTYTMELRLEIIENPTERVVGVNDYKHSSELFDENRELKRNRKRYLSKEVHRHLLKPSYVCKEAIKHAINMDECPKVIEALNNDTCYFVKNYTIYSIQQKHAIHLFE